MQNPRVAGHPREEVSKPVLLGLTTAIIAGIIAPFIIPHITHEAMIYRIIIHLATITVAAFLTIVSSLAYGRTRSIRILLMTGGFIALTVAELLYFLDSTDVIALLYIPTINTELSHVILLTMLVLFALGVLKTNERRGIEQ